MVFGVAAMVAVAFEATAGAVVAKPLQDPVRPAAAASSFTTDSLGRR